VQRSFSVVLPLKKKDRIDPGDLITELRLLVEQTGASVRIDPRMAHQAQPRKGGLLASLRGSSAPDVFAFELDGVRLRVSNHAEPFAGRGEIGRYVNPVMWDQGLGEFTDHRAYYKIHEAGIEGEEGPDAIFDRAAAVTATASVVARFTEPVGAVWVSARNSVPRASFAAALEELRGGQAPLRFWLRWHVLPPDGMEDHNSGIITSGLAPFAGHELMARPSAADTREMIDHAFELSRRMIDEKLTFTDGQIVGGIRGASLKVKLGMRHRREEAPVCEVMLVDPPATAEKPRASALPEDLQLQPGQVLPAPPIIASGGQAAQPAVVDPSDETFAPAPMAFNGDGLIGTVDIGGLNGLAGVAPLPASGADAGDREPPSLRPVSEAQAEAPQRDDPATESEPALSDPAQSKLNVPPAPPMEPAAPPPSMSEEALRDQVNGLSEPSSEPTPAKPVAEDPTPAAAPPKRRPARPGKRMIRVVTASGKNGPGGGRTPQ